MAINRSDDGDPNVITYLFTDNTGNRIEELPLTGVTFSKTMNSAGPFQGSLNVNDPKVQKLSWISATAPNLAQLWIDIQGTLVYGGRVTKRSYKRSTGMVTVSGLDHASYLTQRLQAKDYATTWSTSGSGAATIARQVIADALAVANSLPLSVSTPAATPTGDQITLSAPISQRSTIDSILNQLSALGWLVGFDYAVDVAYVAGVPTATLTLSYPRRGRIAGTTGLTLDVEQALDFTYDEEGTTQANTVVETATGTGGLAQSGAWTPSMTVDGYPLLEKVGMHSSFSSSSTPTSVTDAYIANDLALGAYPVVTPQIVMPLFAEPVIGEWITGDDVRVIVGKNASVADQALTGQYNDPALTFDNPGPFNPQSTMLSTPFPPTDPRFPNGMDFYWRITKADVSIPDAGTPTVTFTFNMPPSSSPQRPPQ